MSSLVLISDGKLDISECVTDSNCLTGVCDEPNNVCVGKIFTIEFFFVPNMFVYLQGVPKKYTRFSKWKNIPELLINDKEGKIMEIST